MPMLDELFNPGTYASTQELLAQLLNAPRPGKAPPEGWAPGLDPPMDVPYPPGGVPPSGPMSSGDGGKLMPVPMPPQQDQAALPPNAAPTADQGPSSPGPVPPASLLGRVRDMLGRGGEMLGNNSNTLLALGAGMAGAQNIGQGMQRGFALAGPAMQTDRANQQQNQTVEALVKRGLPRDVAQAAATNPAIMQQLLPQLFGPKQLEHVTIKGTMNQDIPLVWDSARGRYLNPDHTPYTGQTSGADLGATGIESVPKEFRSRVQGILDGREAPPPSGSRSPQAQALLQYAAQAEPGFDFTKWTTRAATAKDFGSGGKSGLAIKSAEQGLDHVGELMKSVDALPDSGSPLINRVWNESKKQFVGNPAYRDVMTNAHAVADEFSALWKGAGHSSDAEIRSWEANLDPNMTRAEWHGQVNKLMGLLGGSLDALETSRARGMATSKELPPILSEKGRAIMNSVGPWIRGEKAPGEPAASAAPASAASEPPKVGAIKDGYRYKGGPPGDPHSWEPVK